jgi:hypothetical protein
VHELPQRALLGHLNDPLGQPGQQDARNPPTTIKRHRSRVDVPPAQGTKRYQNKGRRLLGRPSLPLPGSQAAIRREKQQRREEADALAAEERRYLRPDHEEDEIEDDQQNCDRVMTYFPLFAGASCPGRGGSFRMSQICCCTGQTVG